MAIVIVILATAGLVGSVTSRWVHDILFDTDTWMETVGPIGTSEVVTDAVAERFSDTLINWIDAEERLAGLLPPALAPVAGRVGDRVDELVVEETRSFLASDIYEQVWLGLAESVHRSSVAIIRDQIPFVSTAGGEVTVDLIPVLTPIADRVLERLTELGTEIPQVILDQVDFDESIAEVIDTYESEGLPAWLGEIQVYSSDRLAVIQQSTALLDRLVWVLPVITLMLTAGAVYFSPRRGRMVVIILGTAGLAWLVASLLVSQLVSGVVGDIESASAAAVANEVFTGITSGLNQVLSILGVLAVVAAMGTGGWLYFNQESDGDERRTG